MVPATTATTLVATLAAAGEVAADLAALPPEVDWLEVRADLVGDLDPEWLRPRFAGGLLYTLRSAREGGRFTGEDAERTRRLAAAAHGYDLVDLEGATDCTSPILSAVPAEQRVVSWHGEPGDLPALRDRFATLAATPARFYKMVPVARAHGEELLALALLRSLQRRDLIAFTGGELGAWTRILAPRLGAAVVFCAAGAAAGAPGQPAAARLLRDFGRPGFEPLEAVSGVAGKPIAHSLSPRLHNAAYRALGLARLYLPFHVESFGDFWLEVVESSALEALGFPLRGLSVTAPFKEAALAVAGVSSPLAERVGAANTLVQSGSVWEAETTDPEGVVGALRAARVEPRGRRAAVVGAGGAGRAAAEGLRQAGATVALVHRDPERGRQAAASLAVAALPLGAFRPAEFELVVHATPLGHRDDDPLPFPVAALRPGTVLMDLVYGEEPTALLTAARAAGCVTIDGREVLVHQAVGQFRLMTGQALPLAVARRAVGLEEPLETAAP